MQLEDIEYIRCACRYAEKHSTDPSTQNGAVLVGDGILVGEANHFPKGCQETAERWQRPLKYSWIEHAERNVLFKAARLGIKTEGLTLYCPFFACSDCSRAIVQCGIKEVVGLEEQWEDEELRKRWLASCEIGDQILKEGGVKFRRLPARVGVSLLRNGKQIEF
jgi:dCMP deaminase